MYICMYVCAAHVCVCGALGGLMRAFWFSWDWSYRGLWTIITWVLGIGPGPLREQELLTTEPNLQPTSRFVTINKTQKWWKPSHIFILLFSSCAYSADRPNQMWCLPNTETTTYTWEFSISAHYGNEHRKMRPWVELGGLEVGLPLGQSRAFSSTCLCICTCHHHSWHEPPSSVRDSSKKGRSQLHCCSHS